MISLKNGTVVDCCAMSFDNLGLHPKILKAVSAAGYNKPTDIQLKAIPKIVRGFDLRASAQTGTGKTAAFLLPALHRLVTPSKKSGKGPRVLILVPTRELAMQIMQQAEKYGRFLQKQKTVCIVGGVPYPKQLRALSHPCDILIATPGRLIDFIEQKKIQFSRLEMLVLDEADRMLDMGFLKPVEKIVGETPADRQTLLFSATLQGSVVKLSERLLNKPMEIAVNTEKTKHENIKQKLHYVDDLNHKNRLLDHILSQEDVFNTIVFTSTKRHADQLVKELRVKGHLTGALHGDMNQRQRTRTIAQLKNGKISILVATDVAARGIDVQSITHVINFDLPNNAEDYVHRIGRTGRAGAQGTAFSFVGNRDAHMIKQIKAFTGQSLETEVIKGLEPSGKKSSEKKAGSFRRKRTPNERHKRFSRPLKAKGKKKGHRKGKRH